MDFEGFCETERGNTWLTAEDGCHYILIGLEVCEEDIEASQYLEISINPANYPALNVEQIEGYNESLAELTKEHYEGWFVRKWNLPVECSVGEDGCLLREGE
jgi:hypothetical protein